LAHLFRPAASNRIDQKAERDDPGARPERVNVQPSDESRLIGEAQAGDKAAFEELVRRYDRGVLRLALRLTGSEDEARDIYQEAFLKLFRALPRFRHDCSLETYLYRIVTNVCLDHVRRRSARPEEPAPARAGDDGRRDVIVERADEAPEADPERALARTQIRRRIEAALEKLAPRERLVFELRHYDGMRLRQIGEQIGTTEETVKNCLFRAHQHLRQALGGLGGFGPAKVTLGTDRARQEA
jgi:RNA polymerase sigma-70 factor, ECF subfamily